MSRRPLMYRLDERGEPQPVPEGMFHVIAWGRWFENMNPTLAFDEIDGVQVPTVFLGVDYGHGDGPPVLWET